MSALPPFNRSGCCPKCGTQGLGIRYLADNRVAQYGSVAWKADPEVFPCMQRSCAGCGFQTLEAPLSPSDSLTTPPPPSDIEKIREMNSGTLEDFV